MDNEYDAVQSAFAAVGGHKHDGSIGEGAPIVVVGPAKDIVVTTNSVTPKTDNTVDLGSATYEFKDLYIDGVANIDSLIADTADINAGTIDATIIGATTPAAATVTSLSATSATVGSDTVTTNTATQTLTNKTVNLSSNTLVATSAQIAAAVTDETGSGALVFATSPTLAGTPVAPTAVAGTNTTQIATTAHVFAERSNTATLTNKTISGGSISGITDLAIADGGTGASTAADALVNLGLTATAAELNALDGITADVTELNKLDGVTATTAEINKLAGLTATTTELNKLAGTPVGLTATELGYVDGVTSAIQTQIDGKQPLDAALTALAAYNTNGVLVQTAADTFTGRTLTAGTGISISNGDGVAGNPTISLKSTTISFTCPAANSSTTTAHGLGSLPSIISVYMTCNTADAGYSIGDVVSLSNISTSGSGVYGHTIQFTSTNIIMRTGDSGMVIVGGANTLVTLTEANWTVTVKCYE